MAEAITLDSADRRADLLVTAAEEHPRDGAHESIDDTQSFGMAGPENSESRHRVEEIDIWRGLAILMVVTGHAVQVTVAQFDQNLLFRGIYAFHMPLFFFISGLVAIRGIDAPLMQQLKARALGLVLPFVSWYLVIQLGGWLLGNSQNPMAGLRSLYFSVDEGLWFLWVLFLCSMFAALLAKIPSVPRVWVLCAGALAVWLVGSPVLGLGLFRYYFAFFAAGLIAAPLVSRGRWKALRRWWVVAIGVALYIAFVLGWRRVGLVPLASSWEAAGLPLSRYLDLLYRYAAAGSGIFATLSIVTFVPLRTPAADLLAYLGRRTLEIYVTHGIFLIPFTLLGLLWAPIAALFACSMSLLSARLLKRIGLLRILLYGGRP